MKRIKLFLIVVFGLLSLTACSLNQTRFEKPEDVISEGEESYKVTFISSDNGEVLFEVSKKLINSINIKDLPLEMIEGFDILIKDESGNIVDVSEIKETTNLYIYCERKPYVISYYANGVLVNSQDVLFGDAIELEECQNIPIGKEFIGWSSSKDEFVELDLEYMPAENISLYAFFQDKDYTIIFVPNLSILDEEYTKTYKYNEKLGKVAPDELLAAIEGLNGFEFVGWYLDAELTQKFDKLFMPNEDLILYAKFNYPGVTFVAFNKVITIETGNVGEQVSFPEAPSVQGYEFVEWLDENGNPVTEAFIGERPQSITASYSPLSNIQYKVEYYLQTLRTSYVFKETKEFVGTTDEEVSAEVLSYDGFSLDVNNQANLLSSKVKGDGSLVLKVYYSRNSYHLVINSNGETLVDGYYKFEQGFSYPTPVNKDGYTFTGWDYDEEIMPNRDLTIEALYTINQYNVKFVSNGETIQEETLDFGANITYPSDPEKEGYTFTGWDSNITSVPSHDVTIEALFSINQYNVKFVSNGETIQENTLDFGANITYPADPEKEGYTFTGWDSNITTVPSHDVTIEALFSINQYDISADTGNFTIADLPDHAAHGSTVEFSVTANDGYAINQVFADGVALTEEDGKYSFTITEATNINVTLYNYYSHSLTTKVYSAEGSQDLGGLNWDLSATWAANSYFGSNSSRFQIGSGNNPATTIDFSTNDVSGIIKKVIVTTAGSSAELSVFVNGQQIGTTKTITTTTTAYEFTCDASGELRIHWDVPSKAVYLTKVEVIYEYVPSYEISSNSGNFTINGLPAKGLENSEIEFTVTPNTYYLISSVKANDVVLTADNEGKYIFTLTEATSIVVETEDDPNYRVINVTKNNNVENVSLPEKAILGDTVEFTVSAADGYEIDSVTFNGEVLTPNTEGKYSFTVSETNDVVINTFFASILYDISADTGNFTIADLPQQAVEGSIVEFSVTANDGYAINQVFANGVALTETNGKYSFTVAEATNISVTLYNSYKYIPVSPYFNENGSKELNGIYWNLDVAWATAGQTYFNFETDRVHIGSNSKLLNGMTLSTSGINGIIKKVILYTSSDNRSFKLYIDGQQIGETLTLNTSFAAREFTCDSFGDIVFEWGTGAKAVYIGQIEVIYESATVYNITPNTGNFTINDLPSRGLENSEIEFTVTPNTYYLISLVKANDVVLTADNEGKYTFTLIEDVSIVVETEDDPSYKSISLTKDANIEDVSLPEKAILGDTIEFTVSAADGYDVDSVTFNGVTLSPDNEGKYSFTVADTNELNITSKVHVVTGDIYTITSSTGNYTITGLPDSAEDGTLVEFSVAASTGYIVTAVKANETALTPDNSGNYSFTITANTTIDVTAKELHTVSVTMSAQGYSNQEVVNQINLDSVITASFDKGSNSNTPKYFNTGSALRIYGGGTMTISAAEGYTIYSVKVTFTNSTFTNLSNNTADIVNAASKEYTVSGTSGHVRITVIEVVYY